jgi:hypothetical protein
MFDQSFETQIGWKGPELKTLVGRDLSVIEKDEERRGPLVRTSAKIGSVYGKYYSICEFRVAWVALKSPAGIWYLEAETDNPSGFLSCTINPAYISVHYDNPEGPIRFWNAIIHPPGDNLTQPEIPTLKPARYIPDQLKG